MFNKVLLPLDGTQQSEGVIPHIWPEIGPSTEVFLLQVLHPVKTQSLGGQVILGSQREAAERLESLTYLRGVARESGNSERWQIGTVMADRASDGIVSYANENGIDAIFMFATERKGLAKLMKGNTCRGVQKHSPAEVRVFTTLDIDSDTVKAGSKITAAASEPGTSAQENGDRRTSSGAAAVDVLPLTTSLLRKVDLFVDLSVGQIDRVASLGKRMTISEGEALGKGGEMGQSLFVIIDGEAQLTAQSGVGEISVRVAGPGDSFPMAALLGSGILITTGEALTDMDVLAISTVSLSRLCSDDAEIGRNVYRAAAQLFAKRYSSTLTHLAASAERELLDPERHWLR